MTWQNWAGNVTASPARVSTPRSAPEVAEEVARAKADGLAIRMTGTGFWASRTNSSTFWRVMRIPRRRSSTPSSRGFGIGSMLYVSIAYVETP